MQSPEPTPSRNPVALHIGASSVSLLIAERDGNTVRIRSEGVRRLRVLVSPDVFDLTAPSRIEANGRTAFEGVLEPSRTDILEWATRDGDRSMLFAAEIAIRP